MNLHKIPSEYIPIPYPELPLNFKYAILAYNTEVLHKSLIVRVYNGEPIEIWHEEGTPINIGSWASEYEYLSEYRSEWPRFKPIEEFSVDMVEWSFIDDR